MDVLKEGTRVRGQGLVEVEVVVLFVSHCFFSVLLVSTALGVNENRSRSDHIRLSGGTLHSVP